MSMSMKYFNLFDKNAEHFFVTLYGTYLLWYVNKNLLYKNRRCNEKRDLVYILMFSLIGLEKMF